MYKVLECRLVRCPTRKLLLRCVFVFLSRSATVPSMPVICKLVFLRKHSLFNGAKKHHFLDGEKNTFSLSEIPSLPQSVILYSRLYIS